MVLLKIYVVRRGDSTYSIASRFGLSVEELARANDLSDPSALAVGQALFVPVISVIHTVRRGQSLYSIAQLYQTTVSSITAANPSLSGSAVIYPGQKLTIPFPDERWGELEVNAFVYPGVSQSTLSSVMPWLTWLSIFASMTDTQGNLSPINDDAVVNAALAASTAPMLTVVNMRPSGGFSSDIAHSVLTNRAAQDNLMNNLTAALSSGRYKGVVLDFEYIYSFDRESYNQFLQRVVETLHPLGYYVFTALAPKISAAQSGLLYEAHDYAFHGKWADRVILMTYEWGYTYGPPMSVAPVNMVRKVLDYAVTVIPSGKILMGVPNYGYDWTLPFVQGSAARSISNAYAPTLAVTNNADILFDQPSQTPYFNYTAADGKRHEVWFDDARSIRAKLRLVADYALAGISIWTADRQFSQLWLVIQSMYSVIRVM